MTQTPGQHAMQDPLTQDARPKFEDQPRSAPGLARDRVPGPDHGETSHRGFGRLAGRRALALPGDITDEAFCTSLVGRTREALGGLDLLVNVAGRQTAVEAIVASTHALARQVADKGIRVNAVAPGPVRTPLQSSGGQPRENIPDPGARVPLRRPGQPAGLAPICVLLASRDSGDVTGGIHGVTGGNHRP